MASSGDQEEKTNEELHNEAASSTSEDCHGVSEGAKSSDSSNEGISMFCKGCLHPYSGEQKSGSLVLKCERCGQTDVIFEDEASSLKPEQWCGNLMMNRFLKVLKEQEDLCLNITDPFFAEDEFQRLHLAISEYTFNMKTVAERMFDIAKKATSTLAEYYETKMNNETEGTEADADDEPDVVYVLPQAVRRHLTNLGSMVLRIMEDLVKKYDLPIEILDKVKERVANEQSAETDAKTESAEIKESSGEEVDEKVVEGAESDKLDIAEGGQLEAGEEVVPDKAGKVETVTYPESEEVKEISGEEVDEKVVEGAESDKLDIAEGGQVAPGEGGLTDKAGKVDTNTEPASEEVKEISGDEIDETVVEGAESDKLDIAEGGHLAAGEGDAPDKSGEEKEEVEEHTGESKQERKKSSDGENNSDEEDYVIFNITKATLEKEVFDALAHKFAVKFDDTEDEAATANGSEGNNDNGTEGDSVNKVKNPTDEPKPYVDPDAANVKTVLDSVEGLRTFVLNTTSDDPSDDPENESNEDQGMEVNFYAVSSAFINELQERKRKALLERKDKALATVNEKITNLKKEVEKVEDTVREELMSAYEKKRQKVENQRRRLDERHQQIQDAERLLDFYARTGQAEKLAELMEQLNVQYEN